MSETEPMSVNQRRKYLHKMRVRYGKPNERVPKTPCWEKIAHSLEDYPCSEQLQSNLVWMVEHLESHGEIEA